MIDIVFSILPIREISLIVTHFGCRGIIFGDRFEISFSWLYLKWFKRSSMCRRKLHRMRINYPCLFFKIKSIFLRKDLSLLHFVIILFLVV